MIFVKAHPKLDKNRVAVVDTTFEQEEKFLGGLSIIKKDIDEVYEVVETGTITTALAENRLVQVDAPVVYVPETKETKEKK